MTVSTDNADSEVTVPELILGGTYSDVVSAFELTASDEDVKVIDLSILANMGANTSTLASYASEVQLYDENMNLIDSESVTDNTVEFENINYVVQQGTETIYVVVKAQLIGYGNPGAQSTPITFTMDVVEADGVDSGDPVAGLIPGAEDPTASTSFSVVPVLLTNVASSMSSCSTLAAGSVVARVKITAPNSNNTTTASPGVDLDTLLSTIQFRVYEA